MTSSTDPIGPLVASIDAAVRAAVRVEREDCARLAAAAGVRTVARAIRARTAQPPSAAEPPRSPTPSRARSR